jgi:L-rhamnose mutarotase
MGILKKPACGVKKRRMEIFLKTKAHPIFWFCGFLFLSATPCLSAVIVYDQVTTVGTPVYLKVLTKGLFFAEGGRLVEFYLDDKSIGKNLTGGDGYGYKKYTSRRAGIIKVNARSKGESGSGLLLVMKKSEKAVLIEIESGFKDAFISQTAASADRRALKKLFKEYRVIYFSRYSRYVGIRATKDWLDKFEFPAAPVLTWRGPQMLNALKARGVHLYAIIGSAEIIGQATEYIERRYTFEQTQNEKTVKDWQEIIELLQKSAPKKSTKTRGKIKPSQK